MPERFGTVTQSRHPNLRLRSRAVAAGSGFDPSNDQAHLWVQNETYLRRQRTQR
jgi:hypothetical protein